MKAIMLAAGVGRRLSGGDEEHPPKVLLEFGGLTLLQRHLSVLPALKVESLTLVVGYRAADIVSALEDAEVGAFVRVVENPDFRRGSLISLWAARDALTSGGDVLVMDADVLYHPNCLERLLATPAKNAFLYDSRLDPGEDPVKICLRDGKPVEFAKRVSGTYDAMGEWVGFLKLSEPYARELAKTAEKFVEDGLHDETTEEVVRALLKSSPAGAFGIADVGDLPWIEIDFPEDVARARDVILPAFAAVKDR